jgi:hypothetical protein
LASSSSLTNTVASPFPSLLMLKFCCQILIAINKEKKINREFNVYLKILFSDSHCYQQRKNIINTENSMFMLKFCSQILIAINNNKINKHRKISMLNFHINIWTFKVFKFIFWKINSILFSDFVCVDFPSSKWVIIDYCQISNFQPYHSEYNLHLDEMTRSTLY